MTTRKNNTTTDAIQIKSEWVGGKHYYVVTCGGRIAGWSMNRKQAAAIAANL